MDNIKRSDVVDILEERDVIQRDLDRLQKRTCANLIKFYCAKFKVLHLGQGNHTHGYRLGHEWSDSRPAEMDLRVLVDQKTEYNQKCALGAQKASHILSVYQSQCDQSGEV